MEWTKLVSSTTSHSRQQTNEDVGSVTEHESCCRGTFTSIRVIVLSDILLNTVRPCNNCSYVLVFLTRVTKHCLTVCHWSNDFWSAPSSTWSFINYIHFLFFLQSVADEGRDRHKTAERQNKSLHTIWHKKVLYHDNKQHPNYILESIFYLKRRI